MTGLNSALPEDSETSQKVEFDKDLAELLKVKHKHKSNEKFPAIKSAAKLVIVCYL